MKLEIDVLSDRSNAAVVKMPGRAFPGLVVQGDTLSILADAVRTDPVEASAILDELLSHYIKVLDAERIGLPFNRPATRG
jgi:hypothetical protein